MMTFLQQVRAGQRPAKLSEAAAAEGLPVEQLAASVAEGTVVVAGVRGHRPVRACPVGRGTRVKVNINMGSSPDVEDLNLEIEKVRLCERLGVDTVMDLSTGPRRCEVRQAVLDAVRIPVGTVPVYEVAAPAICAGRDLSAIEEDDFFSVIQQHACDGVDFVTVHAAITRADLQRLREQPRVAGVVSRGGSVMGEWMARTGRENPYFARFDDLLSVLAEHDVVLSLGDALRPGAGADAGDDHQQAEERTMGELVLRAREAGVQVMAEGPGHVPLDKVERDIRRAATRVHGAPQYILGPICTDAAAGHDHIAGAIGAAVAALAGADFLCAVTPAEHLRLPTLDDIRQGIMAFRVAAHVADVARGVPSALARDRMMSEARRRLCWAEQIEHAIDFETVRAEVERQGLHDNNGCGMCGEICALKRQM